MMSKILAPLSGIAFLAFLAAGILYGGKPPSAEDKLSAEELTAQLLEKGDALRVSVLLLGIALLFLFYFASTIKSALDSGEGETGLVSRVAFAGVLIFIAGAATDLTLMLAMIEAAKDKVDPIAIQALSAYWKEDFVPFAVGLVAMHSAVAISALKHGGLPKWLGAVSALIAIVGVTPVGFAVMPATGVWILLASIVLTVRAAKADT